MNNPNNFASSVKTPRTPKRLPSLPALLKRSETASTIPAIDTFLNQCQLVEDDDTYLPLPSNKYEQDEDNYRRDLIRRAKVVRRLKLIVTLLTLPFLFCFAVIFLALFSFSLIIRSSKKIMNIFAHILSFVVYFGMMGGVMFIVIILAKQLREEGNLSNAIIYAQSIFFFAMFVGTVLGVGKANFDPQFLGVDYPSVRVRFNLDNALAVISLVTELISLCAFVFRPEIPWSTDTDFRFVIRWWLFNFGFDTFTFSFFLMVATVCIFFIFVTLILTLHYYVGMSLVEMGSYKIVNILFPLLSETIFIPVVTVMMQSMKCTEDQNGVLYLDAKTSIECWTGIHTFYAGFSMIALLSYFPTALFMGTRLAAVSDGAFVGEKLDIKYKPIFYMWASFMRCIIAGISTFFYAYKKESLSAILVGHLILLSLNIYFEPCCVKVVNKARSLIYVAAAWSTIAALIALLINNEGSLVSFIIWATGIGVIVIGIILAIATHKTHSSNIEVYAFGQGGQGELGLGAQRDIHYPLRNGNLYQYKIDKLVCRDRMNFAITSDRHVFCWGHGDLFTFPCPPTGILEPIQVPDLTSKKITNIVVGSLLAVAVTESGQALYWTPVQDLDELRARVSNLVGSARRPSNVSGGIGSPKLSARPTPPPKKKKHDKHDRHPSLEIIDEDNVMADTFQLHQSVSPIPIPGEVMGLCIVKVIISAGNSVFLIASDGRVYVFGFNREGILGYNRPAVLNQAEPLEGLEDVFIVDIFVHTNRVFAISNQGELYAWGNGSYGVLGHGTFSDVKRPLSLRFFTENELRVVQAACNDYYAVALVEDGRLFMWGRYEPIDMTRNDFLPTKPLPSRREDTQDLWPREVLSLTGLPVVKIFPGCPECLLVMIDDHSLYRIVFKPVIASPERAAMIWQTIQDETSRQAMQGNIVKRSGKALAQHYFKKNAAMQSKFRGVEYTTESYLVARRMLGGLPVTYVEASPDLVACSQTLVTDINNKVRLTHTFIRALFYHKQKFTSYRGSVLDYADPIVAGKDYYLTGIHKISVIKAGRSHITALAAKHSDAELQAMHGGKP